MEEMKGDTEQSCHHDLLPTSALLNHHCQISQLSRVSSKGPPSSVPLRTSARELAEPKNACQMSCQHSAGYLTTVVSCHICGTLFKSLGERLKSQVELSSSLEKHKAFLWSIPTQDSLVFCSHFPYPKLETR